MDVMGYKLGIYILEDSLEEIRTQDKMKVAKVTTENTSSEEAAKKFLIQEKKRPIELDKQGIKACFQNQLLKCNF